MSSKEELLKYKFELEVAYDGLGRGLDIADVKDAISLGIVGYEKIFNLLFNPKPYNFEDFKVGMWILDRKPQYEEYTFIKIIKILSESDCEYLYHDKDKKIFFDNMECSAREFEENRFFPVQYANLIKMEVKK